MYISVELFSNAIYTDSCYMWKLEGCNYLIYLFILYRFTNWIYSCIAICCGCLNTYFKKKHLNIIRSFISTIFQLYSGGQFYINRGCQSTRENHRLAEKVLISVKFRNFKSLVYIVDIFNLNIYCCICTFTLKSIKCISPQILIAYVDLNLLPRIMRLWQTIPIVFQCTSNILYLTYSDHLSSRPGFGGVCIAHLFSLLCCPIMCRYVLGSVFWCPLQFLHRNDVRFVFASGCL